MVTLPITRAGSVYAQVKAKFPNADIQETSYRYYYKLTPTSLPFNLNLTAGTGQHQPGENYISLNDGTVLYAMAMALVKVNTKALGNVNNYASYSYPDLEIFNGPAVSPPGGGLDSPTEAECLESIYHGGNIQLKANSTILLDYLSTKRFRRVPIVQSDPGALQASYNQETPQMVDIIQPQVLTGKDTLELIISPGSGADLSQIGGVVDTENYLVIDFDAFVLKNYATSVTSGNLDKVVQAHSMPGRR
ncbi:MAG: hypothetical protein ACRBFS_24415 [Aureispira sp.]